jgi:hypothetical protein
MQSQPAAMATAAAITTTTTTQALEEDCASFDATECAHDYN